MKKTNIYLSLPVNLTGRKVVIEDICTKIKYYAESPGNHNVQVDYYKEGQEYTDLVVSNCDIFIFTDINMQWNCSIPLLPSGVKSELKKAMSLGKPIFYIYKTSSGELNLYKCSYQWTSPITCAPIAGSTSAIYQLLDDFNVHFNRKVSPTKQVENLTIKADSIITLHKGFDRRLLL